MVHQCAVAGVAARSAVGAAAGLPGAGGPGGPLAGAAGRVAAAEGGDIHRRGERLRGDRGAAAGGVAGERGADTVLTSAGRGLRDRAAGDPGCGVPGRGGRLRGDRHRPGRDRLVPGQCLRAARERALHAGGRLRQGVPPEGADEGVGVHLPVRGRQLRRGGADLGLHPHAAGGGEPLPLGAGTGAETRRAGLRLLLPALAGDRGAAGVRLGAAAVQAPDRRGLRRLGQGARALGGLPGGYVRGLYAEHGFADGPEVYYGAWSGRRGHWPADSGLGDQDTVVATVR